MNNLKSCYLKNVIPNLIKKFQYKNIHEVPKIKTIIINRGLGLKGQNRLYLQKSIEELRIITCQHPIIILAKKSIATFNIKKDMPIGLKVTLRRQRMYSFLEKIIHLVFPRIQNFQGLSSNSFDKNGNYNFGINDQLLFPDIDYENVESKNGLNISIYIETKSILESSFLLKELGFPLIIK